MTQRSIADDVVFVPLCGEHAGWAVSSDGLPCIPLLDPMHVLSQALRLCCQRVLRERTRPSVTQVEETQVAE